MMGLLTGGYQYNIFSSGFISFKCVSFFIKSIKFKSYASISATASIELLVLFIL